jgi:uncharacterized membrane protein
MHSVVSARHPRRETQDVFAPSSGDASSIAAVRSPSAPPPPPPPPPFLAASGSQPFVAAHVSKKSVPYVRMRSDIVS